MRNKKNIHIRKTSCWEANTKVATKGILKVNKRTYGPGSSVRIETDYGLDGPGSNPGGDEIFRPSRRPWSPLSLLYNGYRVFLGGRGGRGVGLTPHAHLVPKVLEKSRAISLLTLRACVAYKKGENLPINVHTQHLLCFKCCRAWQFTTQKMVAWRFKMQSFNIK